MIYINTYIVLLSLLALYLYGVLLRFRKYNKVSKGIIDSEAMYISNNNGNVSFPISTKVMSRRKVLSTILNPFKTVKIENILNDKDYTLLNPYYKELISLQKN